MENTTAQEKQNQRRKSQAALERWSPRLTDHARRRMSERSISPNAVATVLLYGRDTHVRGAVIYAVGRKEILASRQRGRDLSTCEGIHVVCASDGQVITTYRNHDFRSLKPRRRHRFGRRNRGWSQKRAA